VQFCVFFFLNESAITSGLYWTCIFLRKEITSIYYSGSSMFALLLLVSVKQCLTLLLGKRNFTYFAGRVCYLNVDIFVSALLPCD
jgi:hypothetical protein